ncbi:MAG: hypothetical protein AD742_14830 [Methylibium sp. NZG]|nr:MAG: hypothetical protein AD742_14830 [Methylibium sp. NZG]
MAERLATLARVEAAVWDELERAVQGKAQGEARSASHAWRTPVLATVNGNGADARTVVLRAVDRIDRRLTFFTDRRAGKVAQLVSHPLATLLMWSDALGWQLRCRAVLTLRPRDATTDGLWARVEKSPAALDYLSTLAPGTPLDIDSPSARDPGGAVGSTPGEHFAVVDAHVQRIDWLELHRDGHRRAVFEGAGARWVQP